MEWKREPCPEAGHRYVSDCGNYVIERSIEFGIGRDRVSFVPYHVADKRKQLGNPWGDHSPEEICEAHARQ